MKNLSPLQSRRLDYRPQLPPFLKDLHSTLFVRKEIDHPDLALQELFPLTFDQPLFLVQPSHLAVPSSPLKVGIIFSGGQAPGGHNVITGLFDALKKIHPLSRLIGFLNGPQGIIENQFTELTEEKIAPYRNQGGFDIIGSGRIKIETSEQFRATGKTLKSHALNGLVIVGGDDSNTNAAFLAEFCKREGLDTRVIGVPKTIDGDLKNDFIEISFGFDTASKIYSETIGNLARDSLSAKKHYFFVKMMGRSASHLTMECALQTHVNMALIGEEVAALKQTLSDVVCNIADLICERSEKNKHFGIILIPEGLLEFIPECQELIKELNHLLVDQPSLLEEKTLPERVFLLQQALSQTAFDTFSCLPESIQNQLLLKRDGHGNVQLSQIETERLLILLVEKELNRRQIEGIYSGKFQSQPFFCGYEGRCGLPSNFDCQYCYALGHLSALLIFQGASGYMCCIKNLARPIDKWEGMGVPITYMMHFETRKNKKQAVIRKALVDLNGPIFTHFQKAREQWRMQDSYCCPGPIQFEGPLEITDHSPLTLISEK